MENKQQKKLGETQINLDKMECPSCKNKLIESITFRRKFLSYYKVYNFLCSCGYEKEKEIKISQEDYLNSMVERNITAENTKMEKTDKKYHQKSQKGELEKE